MSGIPGEIIAEGRVAVGILIDANDNLQSRWEAVASRLRKAKIAPPAYPTPDGTIIDSIPRVGVWLMPDNKSSGELENFVERMIPSSDPAWPLSENYVDGIPERDRKFAPQKIQRAKVHSWLATREDPRRMGSAIRTGDLKVDGTDVRIFVDWLRELFG